jgi:hypothetical protein
MTVACAADDVCLPLGDGMGGTAHDTAGVCIPAADVDFTCA